MREILKRGFVILEGALHSGKVDGKITFRSKNGRYGMQRLH